MGKEEENSGLLPTSCGEEDKEKPFLDKDKCGNGPKKGICKWFDVNKGFGFITPEDSEGDDTSDVFVHQSSIHMNGFRSLEAGEEVEFYYRKTEKGLEATLVTSVGGGDCKGSSKRPKSKKKSRKIRCYNCGEFANHIAAKCRLGPQPKRCHNCKSEDHLIADCPNKQLKQSSKCDANSQLENDNSVDSNGPEKLTSDEDQATSETPSTSSSNVGNESGNGIQMERVDNDSNQANDSNNDLLLNNNQSAVTDKVVINAIDKSRKHLDSTSANGEIA
ncbi:hypothetical protein CHUAL_002261 [Chamberlinius hualienensis]